MDCRRFRMLISREIDGESTVAGREELARHIESCGDCRAFGESVRTAAAAHRSIPEVSPDRRVIERIVSLAAARPEPLWNRRWMRLALPVAAAAVFVLGFWIGSLMHDRYRGPAQTETASAANGAEQLDLEYLGECPPGSFGTVLEASYDGGAR